MGNIESKFGREFLDQILEFVRDNYEPQDIFDQKTLKTWAEDNGYIPEDS